MTGATWGYSGQVGEWFGELEIPPLFRQPPIAAAHRLLDDVLPIVGSLHRPRQMQVSWAEYGAEGQEVGFHELEDLEVASWEAVVSSLDRLAGAAQGAFALSSLFIKLDTEVVEANSTESAGIVSIAEASAELQISIPAPEFASEIATVRYATFIDVWLSSTYGERYTARANHLAAARNRPHLEAMLRALSGLLGTSYRMGQSQLYPEAITPLGFRDFDLLPPRTSK